ncbi:hypothetical protein DEO72_LG8g1203 [Vigna unguiculata]|uniref:Uncharacterized protein n=1 Tax=Vigna unguiculata TaxID=3917 RepID=A0A4D6MRC3_VIGUN|nr:hypothetical protein DEO72_LG8g1203 [Vigna unguiculata]
MEARGVATAPLRGAATAALRGAANDASWCGERRFVVWRGFRGGATAELCTTVTVEARGAATTTLRDESGDSGCSWYGDSGTSWRGGGR